MVRKQNNRYLAPFDLVQKEDATLYLRREYRDELLASGIARPGSLPEAEHLKRSCGVEMQLSGKHLFLKQYFRGGLLAGFHHDTYLSERRFLKEVIAYEKLAAAGIGVPKVYALVIRRSRCGRRAWLLTGFIEQAVPFIIHVRSLDQSGRSAVAEAIGGILRRMHRANVLHPDLTVHNIVIQADGKVAILDFDRCSFLPCPVRKMLYLFRLHRSAVKRRLWYPEAGSSEELRGDPADIEREDLQAFFKGYFPGKNRPPRLAGACFFLYRLWEKMHAFFWSTT